MEQHHPENGNAAQEVEAGEAFRFCWRYVLRSLNLTFESTGARRIVIGGSGLTAAAASANATNRDSRNIDALLLVLYRRQ